MASRINPPLPLHSHRALPACLPLRPLHRLLLLLPQAWVFAALDDEEASTLYYSLAFIYALPYLGNGFELDGFALLSLAICILHVQVGGWARLVGVGVGVGVLCCA